MKTVASLVIGLAIVAAAAVAAAQKPLVISLQWALNVHGDHPEQLPSIETTGGMRALKIENVVDRREKTREIGENTERQEPVPILTDSDVAGFVTSAVRSQLRSSGLNLVSESPDRILTLELVDFWATENRGYRAAVRVRAKLADTQGHEVWSGAIIGIGENWGRSLKEENYQETFSNATFDMIVSLFGQEGFKSGLRQR